MATKETIVKWLSTWDVEAKHTEALSKRLPGGTDWILEDEVFQDWLAGTRPILWAHGIPSTGKTVCSAIVVDHLRRHVASPRDAVAVLYGDYDNEDLTTLVLLSSVCAQLAAQTTGDLPALLEKLHSDLAATEQKLNIDEVMLVLVALCDGFERIFLCLDELTGVRRENGQRRVMIHKLQWLVNRGVQLYVSSGTHGNVPECCACHADIDEAMKDAEVLVIEAARDDIRLSLWDRLRKAPNGVEDLLAAGEVPQEIIENLVSDCGGMFLMAHMKLDRKLRETKALLRPEKEPTPPEEGILFHARALVDYTPSHAGGLPFRKGDIISILEIVHENSWAGAVRGIRGNFPRVRVEKIENLAEEMRRKEDAETTWRKGLEAIRSRSSRRNTFAMTTLAWISHASVAIKTDDLVKALSYEVSSEPTYRIWAKNRDVRIEGTDGEAFDLSTDGGPPDGALPLEDICEGLIEIDEDCNLTLLGGWSPSEEELAKLFPNYHYRIAKLCLTILWKDVVNLNRQRKEGERQAKMLSLGKPWEPFKTFAEESWGNHIRKCDYRDIEWLVFSYLTELYDSKPAWVEEQRPFFGDPYYTVVEDDETPVLKAARLGLNPVLEVLLQNGEFDVNAMSYQRETTLSVAVKAGFTKSVQLVYRFGASLHYKNEYGESLLHIAAGQNDEIMVALLEACGLEKDTLSAGYDVNTPLHKAIAVQSIEVANVLLNRGAEVTGELINNAAKSGNLEMMKLLLERDSTTITIGDLSDGRDMPLYSAVSSGSIPMVEYILSKGGRISQLDGRGTSLVHYAAQEHDFAMVKYLVEHTDDPMLAYREDEGPNEVCDGVTAVESAMRGMKGSSPEIVEYLIARMPSNVPTSTLLGMAATAIDIDDADLAKRLIATASNPLEHARLRCDSSLVGAVVRKDNEEVLKILLDRGIAAGVADKTGWTPLHVAADRNSSRSAEMLIAHGVDLDSRTRYGMTPLHVAVDKGNLETLRVLLDHGADHSLRADDGSTALVVAGCSRKPDVARFLVEYGVDINASNIDGETILHYAVMDGNVELVRLLLDYGINLSVLSRRGGSALHFAAYKGNLEIVDLLIERGAAVDLPHSYTGDGFSAPEAYGRTEVLLWNQIGTERRDRPRYWSKIEPGWTPLHSAACVGDGDVVSALLLHGQADLSARGAEGETPLHVAASAARVGIISLLAENGADINAKTLQGDTALHWAALAKAAVEAKEADDHFKCNCQMDKEARHAHPDHSKVECINVLLGLGADPAMDNSDGQTPLALAVTAGHEDAVEALMENTPRDALTLAAYVKLLRACQKKGASANALEAVSDRFDETPESVRAWCDILSAATLEGDEEMVALAIRKGGTPASWGVVSTSEGKSNPFHHAIMKGHLSIVDALIDAGVDIRAVDEQARTALHIAASHEGFATLTIDRENRSREQITVLLFRAGAEPNARTPEGNGRNTALHFAAGAGDVRVVHALLRIGASVNIRNAVGRTPLHDAVSGWTFSDVVATLLSWGACASATDLDGYTPLHLIRSRRSDGVEVLNLLLKAGADPCAPARGGDQPLHCATRRANMPVFRRLLEVGAQVRARGARGRTALHVAARYGHVSCVEILLGSGLKVEEVDAAGWTAVHHAVWGKHLDVLVTMLAEGREDKKEDRRSVELKVPIEEAIYARVEKIGPEEGDNIEIMELLEEYGWLNRERAVEQVAVS